MGVRMMMTMMTVMSSGPFDHYLHIIGRLRVEHVWDGDPSNEASRRAVQHRLVLLRTQLPESIGNDS